MSEVTAVPIRPIDRRILVTLWIGVAALILVAVFGAWRGTAKAVARQGGPAEYLAWNGKRAGVTTTASGLQYQIIKPGKGGARPTLQDVVLVAYEGRLRDGKIFDKNDKAPLELSAVIPGWSEGLQLMTKGAKYRFWIPPALAYGSQAAGPIPADSDLEFDVELLDFIPAALLRQQMQMQGMAAPGGGAPHGGLPPGM